MSEQSNSECNKSFEKSGEIPKLQEKPEEPKIDDFESLLDSALQDFGKALPKPGAQNKRPQSKSESQKSAEDFQKMLQSWTEMQETGLDFFQQHSPGTDTKSDSTNSSTRATMQEMINNFNGLLNSLENPKPGEPLPDSLEELSKDLPLLPGLMSALVEKEVLYPPLAMVRDKYPVWIEENRTKVDQSELQRHETLSAKVSEICSEFEAEKDDDDRETKETRATKIMEIMNEMSQYGHPPDELMGEMPEGFNIDPMTKLPKITDPEAFQKFLQQDKGSEACEFM